MVTRKSKRPVTKAKATNRTVKPKAKLRPRKSTEQIREELTDVHSVHQTLSKLEDMAEKLDVNTQAVDDYIKAKRAEEGRELDTNERTRLLSKDFKSDLDDTLKQFMERAEAKSAPFTTARAVREGSYAKDRKFADSDFDQAKQRIDALENQIANATKTYLKSKRELILLTKMLERAYHDMDEDGNQSTKEAQEFNIAHLSRQLFPSLLH